MKKREYSEKWITFYRVKLNNNLTGNCMVGNGSADVWYKKFDESTKREYYELDDYKVKKEKDEEIKDLRSKEVTKENT